MIQLKKIDWNFKRALKRRKREAEWAKEDGTAKPSRLSVLSSDISAFTRSRSFKLYLLAVLLTAVVLAGILVSVGLVKKSSLKSRMAEEATFNEFVGQSTEILKVSDLAIPDSFKGEEKEGPIRYRERIKKWTPEMAAPYKNDSRALAEEILAEENEKRIREILND